MDPSSPTQMEQGYNTRLPPSTSSLSSPERSEGSGLPGLGARQAAQNLSSCQGQRAMGNTVGFCPQGCFQRQGFLPMNAIPGQGCLPFGNQPQTSWGWIRATTFEGTLQGGLEGSLPGGGTKVRRA